MSTKDTRDSQILNSVAQTYDTIAESWDRVRRRPGHVWNILLPYIHDGSSVLDVGCGNGRLSEFLASKNVQYSGIDGSKKLIEIAKHRYASQNTKYQIPNTPSFFVAPMQALPFTDASFDVVTCLAALQHLPSPSTRLRALHEMHRVIRPGGRLLLTNWNLYHPHMLWRFRLISLLWGNRDVMVPWKLPDGSTHLRYYHSFLVGELRSLLSQSGWTVDEIHYTNSRGRASFIKGMFSFAVATHSSSRV